MSPQRRAYRVFDRRFLLPGRGTCHSLSVQRPRWTRPTKGAPKGGPAAWRRKGLIRNAVATTAPRFPCAPALPRASESLSDMTGRRRAGWDEYVIRFPAHPASATRLRQDRPAKPRSETECAVTGPVDGQILAQDHRGARWNCRVAEISRDRLGTAVAGGLRNAAMPARRRTQEPRYQKFGSTSCTARAGRSRWRRVETRR